LVDMFTGSSSS